MRKRSLKDIFTKDFFDKRNIKRFLKISALIFYITSFIHIFLLPLNDKEGNFLRTSYLLFKGYKPFIDFFQTDPYFYNFFLQYIHFFSYSINLIYVIRAISFLFFTGGLIFIYKSAGFYFRKSLQLLIVIFFCASASDVLFRALYFAPGFFFYTAGLYFYIEYSKRSKSIKNIILSGFLLGLAFLIDYHLFFSVIIIIVLMFRFSRKSNNMLNPFSIYLVSFLFGSTAILVHMNRNINYLFILSSLIAGNSFKPLFILFGRNSLLILFSLIVLFALFDRASKNKLLLMLYGIIGSYFALLLNRDFFLSNVSIFMLFISMTGAAGFDILTSYFSEKVKKAFLFSVLIISGFLQINNLTSDYGNNKKIKEINSFCKKYSVELKKSNKPFYAGIMPFHPVFCKGTYFTAYAKNISNKLRISDIKIKGPISDLITSEPILINYNYITILNNKEKMIFSRFLREKYTETKMHDIYVLKSFKKKDQN